MEETKLYKQCNIVPFTSKCNCHVSELIAILERFLFGMISRVHLEQLVKQTLKPTPKQSLSQYHIGKLMSLRVASCYLYLICMLASAGLMYFIIN